MQIRQIRNATIKIHYGGKVFLVDPWLAPKDGFGCFAGLPESIPFKTPDSQKTFISMPICPLPTIRIILIWRWTEQLGMC